MAGDARRRWITDKTIDASPGAEAARGTRAESGALAEIVLRSPKGVYVARRRSSGIKAGMGRRHDCHRVLFADRCGKIRKE
jgi:hypothetical protein